MARFTFPALWKTLARLRGHRLICFLAQAEALGTSLLIAMAFGLPVVASARGGIPEVMEDGKNGLLLNDSTPAVVASAIERLLDDPQTAPASAAAARETITRASRKIDG